MVPSRVTSDTAIEDLPLKKYQLTSVQHGCAHPFFALFLDPGLGKTLVVLVIFYLLKKSKLIDWMLVVAPLRPCYQVWPAEVKKWGFSFTTAVLHGPMKGAEIEKKADIYIINYDGLSWLHDLMPKLTRRGLGWLVIDESTKVKHTQSLRHRTLKTMLQCFGRRTILTGTPLPNGYIDLFGQIYCLDLGKRLGPFITLYRNLYFVGVDDTGTAWVPSEDQKRPPQGGFLRWHPTKKGQKTIQEKVADICLRFSDKDLGLPPWTPNKIYIELPPKARKQYDTLEALFEVSIDIEGAHSVLVSASNSGVLGQKLRQIANGGLYAEDGKHIILHEEKSAAVMDLFDELNGKSLFTAYEFDHDLERLKRAAKKELGSDVPHVGGDVKIKESLELMRRFNAGLEPFLLVQSSMMEGLNLQEACHNVCWHSLTWNAEHYIQLIKRIHRLGQKHKVFVHHIIARNTRDERVMGVCTKKGVTQDQFLDAIRGAYGR